MKIQIKELNKRFLFYGNQSKKAIEATNDELIAEVEGIHSLIKKYGLQDRIQLVGINTLYRGSFVGLETSEYRNQKVEELKTYRANKGIEYIGIFGYGYTGEDKWTHSNFVRIEELEQPEETECGQMEWSL